jgi:hypothetical protein
VDPFRREGGVASPSRGVVDRTAVSLLAGIGTDMTGSTPTACAGKEIPANRNVTETVTSLTRMARLVLADLTEPSSILQEFQAIVPDVQVPVQPLLQEGFEPWSMFLDLKRKYYLVLGIQILRGTGRCSHLGWTVLGACTCLSMCSA